MRSKLLLFVFLFLSAYMTPVYAQAESDPFELPHPTTHEPGVWIPPWVQRLHLTTDAKLKTCTEEQTARAAQTAEKNAEIAARIAAYSALKDGLGHTQSQLANVQQQLQDSKASSETRLVWALIATGGALLTGTVLALQAAF
jgi:hypothetical protein